MSLDLVRSHPWWWIVLAPAVGGLVVGPLVYFFAREAKGHGVPEVMEAVAVRAGVIRPRLVVVKTLASAICDRLRRLGGPRGPHRPDRLGARLDHRPAAAGLRPAAADPGRLRRRRRHRGHLQRAHRRAPCSPWR